MRTDERAGQAAKYTLQEIEDRLRKDADRHPDGASIPLRPDERLSLIGKAELLRRICGVS